MKICLITTLNHNPGDDFVRSGIEYLMSRLYSDSCFVYIHKHIPATVNALPLKVYLCPVYQAIPHGMARKCADRVLNLMDYPSGSDSITGAGLLIQSGAPIFWKHEKGNTCTRNEWYGPLIRKRWSPRKNQIPFLNLGGGACQGFFSDGTEFENDREILDYAREIHDACRLTTVRDEISRRIFEYADRNVELLPCPSIFAGARHHIQPGDGDFVALNFMPGGGHFRFTGGIDPDQWKSVFRAFLDFLKGREEVILVCHNKSEWKAAKRLFPDTRSVEFDDHRSYLDLYAQAKMGFVNRVHAGFALASFGKPAYVIGSDSRSRMSAMIGLKDEFVGNITAEKLIGEYHNLEQQRSQYPDMIRKIKRKAEDRYLELIGNELKE